MIILFLLALLILVGFNLIKKTAEEEPLEKCPVATEIVKRILKYINLILQYSREKNIDPILTGTIIYIESSGNPKAYREEPQIHDASTGLMQILFKTAKSVGYGGTSQGLFDPETNIKYGTKYLSKCLIAEKGNIFNTMRAYNGGTGWRKSSAKSLEMTMKYAEKGTLIYHYLKTKISV